MVGLKEGHFPFGVAIVTEDVGDLFEDQDHADGREEAFDDAGGEEGGDEPDAGDPHYDLHQSGDHHGRKKGFERSESGNLSGNDSRGTG